MGHTMPTTTIRLPDDLKTRVARAAERAGMTAHSFILEAIAEKARAQEQRDALHGLADQRYAELVASGETVPWDAMRRYLAARVAAGGKSVKRPAAQKTTR